MACNFIFPLLAQLSSVESLSRVRLFVTPWIAAARPPCPSPTPRVHSDPRPSSQWCHPSSHLILCRSLLLLPPTPPSIRVFSNESTLRMRWLLIVDRPRKCIFVHTYLYLCICQFSSVAQLRLTLWDSMDCSSHPLSSPYLLPSIFPSIGVFSNESVVHIRWPNCWSFQLQHQSF